MSDQGPAGSLAGFEAAKAWILEGVAAVAPVDLPLADAVGMVAGDAVFAARAVPARDLAALDGWALASGDLVGASAYAPAMLAPSPVRIEVGEPMPEGCDCVVEAEWVGADGPFAEVTCEAIPGEGVRRAGDDIAEGARVLEPGRRVSAVDIACARALGLVTLPIRRPRLRLVDLACDGSLGLTTGLVSTRAVKAGAETVQVSTERDAASIAAAMAGDFADLVVVVGGTGAGGHDQTAAALARAGTLFAHGLALRPGRTAAIGRIGDTPVIALPGQPDQAMAAWLALAEPLLARLSGARARPAVARPLAHKISSAIGMAELVLLQQAADAWTPLSCGELPLGQLAAANAWCLVAAASEGDAAGTILSGSLLDEAP
ncbi:molybdopterin-binding protein [Aurantimonas sp. A2-1-M11]|uniref:molybdopterin-binding protein n=1 Tax=Aurantimonas sp. A2-1-M11 TaxID=3113712 RepID=UPI002F9504E3